MPTSKDLKLGLNLGLNWSRTQFDCYFIDCFDIRPYTVLMCNLSRVIAPWDAAYQQAAEPNLEMHDSKPWKEPLPQSSIQHISRAELLPWSALQCSATSSSNAISLIAPTPTLLNELAVRRTGGVNSDTLLAYPNHLCFWQQEGKT